MLAVALALAVLEVVVLPMLDRGFSEMMMDSDALTELSSAKKSASSVPLRRTAFYFFLSPKFSFSVS